MQSNIKVATSDLSNSLQLIEEPSLSINTSNQSLEQMIVPETSNPHTSGSQV